MLRRLTRGPAGAAASRSRYTCLQGASARGPEAFSAVSIRDSMPRSQNRARLAVSTECGAIAEQRNGDVKSDGAAASAVQPSMPIWAGAREWAIAVRYVR